MARKLLILARTAGYDVGMEDIHLIPFVDKKYSSIQDPQEYIEAISAEDEVIAEMVKEAKANNQRVRFVAEMNVDGDSVQLFT